MTFLEGDALQSSSSAESLADGNHAGKHNELRAALLELRDELLPDVSTLVEGDLLKVDAAGRLVRVPSGTYPLMDGANFGQASIDGGDVVIAVTTQWGIDSSGSPYFNDDGPTAGEEAITYVNSDGELAWRLVSEVS